MLQVEGLATMAEPTRGVVIQGRATDTLVSCSLLAAYLIFFDHINHIRTSTLPTSGGW